MKVGILSDIHANLAAFKSAIDATRECDTLWFLGDLVVYGPQPVECVELLSELRHRFGIVLCGNNDFEILRGSHESADIQLDAQLFGGDDDASKEGSRTAAEMSATWTRKRLQDDDLLRLLEAPPRDPKPVRGMFDNQIPYAVAHASPFDVLGSEGNYISSPARAEEAFVEMESLDGLSYFVGHTHSAVIVEQIKQHEGHIYGNTVMHRPSLMGDVTVSLRPAGLPGVCRRLIINPGSVGMPRGNDGRVGRAYFALVDTKANTVSLEVAQYDYRLTLEAYDVAVKQGLDQVAADLFRARLQGEYR